MSATSKDFVNGIGCYVVAKGSVAVIPRSFILSGKQVKVRKPDRMYIQGGTTVSLVRSR